MTQTLKPLTAASTHPPRIIQLACQQGRLNPLSGRNAHSCQPACSSRPHSQRRRCSHTCNWHTNSPNNTLGLSANIHHPSHCIANTGCPDALITADAAAATGSTARLVTVATSGTLMLSSSQLLMGSDSTSVQAAHTTAK